MLVDTLEVLLLSEAVLEDMLVAVEEVLEDMSVAVVAVELWSLEISLASCWCRQVVPLVD